MTTNNLLEDVSYPVQTRNGNREWVTVMGVFRKEDPPVHPDFGRPDLDVAFLEFLIGLMTTAAPPRDVTEWGERLKSGWTPDEVDSVLKPWIPFFHLFGSQAFEQDGTVGEKPEMSAGDLLFDAPGEQTIRRNTDHHVKRGAVRCMAPGVAAMTLHAKQSFCGGGGKGHMVTPRGGGPMTSIVIGRTLAETVWLNVPDVDGMLRGMFGRFPKPKASGVLPWTGASLSTADTGLPVRPDDGSVHPLHVFWPMPLRIRLHAEDGLGVCDVTGATCSTVVSGASMRPKGIQYLGGWRHPLSPTREGNDGVYTLHVGASGIDYESWLGVVMKDPAGKGRPAPVVSRCSGEGRKHVEAVTPGASGRARVLAAGYNMDKAKAVHFASAEMPVLLAGNEDEDVSGRIARDAERMVKASQEAVNALSGLAADVADAKESAATDLKKRERANAGAMFKDATRRSFYEHLSEIFEAVTSEGSDEETERSLEEVRKAWLDDVVAAAESCARVIVSPDDFDPEKAGTIARAERTFRNRLYGRPMKTKILALRKNGESK